MSEEGLALNVPKGATLRRYGLSESEWRKMADAQGLACYVCRRIPRTGRLCIDHEHVKGWKKMPAVERKRYVRGLLCWVCNHYYLGRGITIEKAKRVVQYLESYANAGIADVVSHVPAVHLPRPRNSGTRIAVRNRRR